MLNETQKEREWKTVNEQVENCYHFGIGELDLTKPWARDMIATPIFAENKNQNNPTKQPNS